MWSFLEEWASGDLLWALELDVCGLGTGRVVFQVNLRCFE